MAKLHVGICDPSGILAYEYEISEEVSFRFYTLAEVGEPYQPKFRDMIKENGWVVEHGRQLDSYPWVADFVTGLEHDHNAIGTAHRLLVGVP